LENFYRKCRKNEGGGDKKSNQHKEGKITSTKTEGVIQDDTPTSQALTLPTKALPGGNK